MNPKSDICSDSFISLNVMFYILWLALIETYPADLRLARHYFFTGNYAAFDTLWSQIPFKYELDEGTEDEFERLGAVYDTLRAHLSTGTELEKLPDPTLEVLKTWASNCDEPGFLSEVILWRNGVQHNPDCSGGGSRPASTFITSDGKQEILKIYPNPANNLLHVEYSATGHSDWLRIFDLQGGLQKEITLPISNNILSIPIGDFNNGLYLLHWFCNGISGYKKVVVLH
ncbi:MAG: T9SS C-terminal target domain-containing protein [Haliscomenobacteraceae bacterium CHB4]|nr:T9SS C-terminal target domain-containing protein [Haliscomenobacteraceae bacterium CHB4]